MFTVGSVEDFRTSKASVKLAVASVLVLPLIGVGCLLFPDIARTALPYYLGIPMVLGGTSTIVAVARERSLDAGKTSFGTAIVLCVLGVLVAVHGARSTAFIGIVWGLLGLQKGAGELDGIIAAARAKQRFVAALALCAVKLVLAVLLVLNPFANIAHHVIVLGVELIVYPFNLHRKHGKLSLEAKA